MRKEKELALKLRLSGKSYSQVTEVLGIPKSTLSGWFSDLVLSPSAKELIDKRRREKSFEGLLRRNKNQTRLAQERAHRAREEGGNEIQDIHKRDVLILGTALYWAEGYKQAGIRNGRELTSHAVSMTNSDPFLIKAFLLFMREYCHVPEEKIKASIRIYQHQNEDELKKFWQKETKIPPENFKKTYYGISKSSMGKRPFNRLPYGVLQVTVADTKLFHKVIGYIEKLKQLV